MVCTECRHGIFAVLSWLIKRNDFHRGCAVAFAVGRIVPVEMSFDRLVSDYGELFFGHIVCITSFCMKAKVDRHEMVAVRMRYETPAYL